MVHEDSKLCSDAQSMMSAWSLSLSKIWLVQFWQLR